MNSCIEITTHSEMEWLAIVLFLTETFINRSNLLDTFKSTFSTSVQLGILTPVNLIYKSGGMIYSKQIIFSNLGESRLRHLLVYVLWLEDRSSSEAWLDWPSFTQIFLYSRFPVDSRTGGYLCESDVRSMKISRVCQA
jgi:hypothetical protein